MPSIIIAAKMAGQSQYNEKDHLSYNPLRTDVENEDDITDEASMSDYSGRPWMAETRGPWSHRGVIVAVLVPWILSLFLGVALVYRIWYQRVHSNLCAQVVYCTYLILI
jgi:hypothetical protein